MDIKRWYNFIFKRLETRYYSFEFIFLYNWLNLAFLTSKGKKTIQKIRLLEEKVVQIFEYRKKNDGY